MVYTKEVLETCCATSVNYTEVARKATGRNKIAGSTTMHIKRKIAEFEIDVSHFTFRTSIKVEKPGTRKPIDEILVHNGTQVKRTRRHHLKRAMDEAGVAYCCAWCGLQDSYNGKPLRLDIDHIDGNWANNLLTNLRYLCPNCHSQTDTFGFTGLPPVSLDE